MDLRRLRAGEWIAGLSGVALIVSLFLPWYGRSGAADYSGWDAFRTLDVVFAIGGLLGVAVVVVTATQRTPAVPVAFQSTVTLLGFAVSALVLYRLASHPGDGREIGVWLATVSALGVMIGSFLAIRDERRSKPGKPTDLTGRPVPPPPEIEALPPPEPAPQ